MQSKLRYLHKLAKAAAERAAGSQGSRGLASQRSQLPEYDAHYRPAEGISTRPPPGQAAASSGLETSSATAASPPEADGQAADQQHLRMQQGAQAGVHRLVVQGFCGYMAGLAVSNAA